MTVEKVLFTPKARTTGSWKNIFMKHSLLRLVFVTLLAAQAAPNAAWAQVQVAPPIPGVIGKVQSFTGRSLDVQTPSGVVQVDITRPLTTYKQIPSDLSHVTSTSYVGVASTEQADGKEVAKQIILAIGATVSHGQPYLPSSFQAKTIHSPEAADIFVRWGGKGPVVVLIHGYAENSDDWVPLAADLMKDHTVVVPDLRGIGKSSKPEGGYDKKTQAKDIRAVVTGLGYDKTLVVAHDIGNMVAYAYAATYPDKVERLVVMDAPIPGIEPWNEILLNPGVWHFNFHGPDAERLVAGRERIYFDRIWNDFTADPGKPDEATRNFFAATYAQPGGMRAGFAQFAAFAEDAKDNKVFEQTKLTM